MVRIGLIGAGHLGKIHLRLLKGLEGVELIGFHDHNPENAEAVSKEFGLTHFDTAEALIEKVDAIDIVTPTVSHFHYASLAIRSFKHVFIEKPVTQTVDEGKKLLSLAHEAGIKGQVGHVERFNPAFTAALPYLSNPMFIETHRLAEFNPRGTDVSVIHDLMIHDIDVVLSVVRSRVKKINASGVAVISDTADIANARIEFESGCIANLTASRISLKKMRKSRFFQRDAYISVDFLKKQTEVVRLKTLTGEAGPLDITINLGQGKGSKLIYFDQPEVKESNAIQRELEMFIEAIRKDKTTPVSLEEGFNALEVAHQVMEKIQQSLKVLA
ncbi:MAG: gfo/Idh/MocA family oxidoreductase [Bacteroidetes bacterium]|nr:MAG: gfo/Idh/MocA family oxidoreductase [Bacteroidota bacterium]REJ99803.1 MAG: gfo/Idh/MocA family oxidoreductase [Bacteroidota bacterium]REK34176.1 MAG: gfo/Idh/MocA family oxidoreductase [Bacteroidota bacterium]REK50506.1 MAG: gfo/Idh/MocA family oxidoreductase [Bacteroidota bacterium]